MNPPSRTVPRRRPWLFAVLALLAGCGGVDSGGTGTGVMPTLAVGAITGFGSVIVNGVRYDDSIATIQDDEGRTIARERLRLGMQAEVEASAVQTVGGVAIATAAAITLRSDVIGPIESIDPDAGILVVLGQTVAVAAATVLDENLAAFAPGDVVEVHGAFDPVFTRIVASRIERNSAAQAYKLRGPVVTRSLADRTVTIGTATIDWSAVAPADPATLLAPGSVVRVTLAIAPANGVWQATSLRAGQVALADRERVELEGRVTAYRSSTSFDVAGVPVDAAAASFPEGRTGLALGAKVEVEGSARGGVVMAASVKIEDDDDAGSLELHGTIEAVDAAARHFVVRGVTVVWNDATRFDSSGPQDIRAGRRVEIRGTLSADGTRVDATTIHVED